MCKNEPIARLEKNTVIAFQFGRGGLEDVLKGFNSNSFHTIGPTSPLFLSSWSAKFDVQAFVHLDVIPSSVLIDVVPFLFCLRFVFFPNFILEIFCF